MSQGGAPIGNQNAKKGKAWADAIRRAIRAKYGVGWEEAIQKLAGKLVDAADDGDFPALKEIGDRLDGKPAQALDIGNKDGEPFSLIQRTIVDPRNTDS